MGEGEDRQLLADIREEKDLRVMKSDMQCLATANKGYKATSTI